MSRRMSKIRSADARRKFFENRRQEYAEFSKKFRVTVVDSPNSPRFRRLFVPKYQRIEQAIACHAAYIAEHIPFTVLMDGAVYETDYLGEDFTETAFSVQGAPMLRARSYDGGSIVASATWRNPFTHAAEVIVSFYAGGGAQIQCLTNEAWQAWWATA